jgi:hypothetical protein
MKTVFAAAFILLSSGLFGQSPLTFDVSRTLVGSARTTTLAFDAVGRWSPDKESSDSHLIGPMSAEVRCFKTLGLCERIGAIVASGPATVAVLQDFDIVRWDDQGIIAVDSTAPCVTMTLRISFNSKSVAQDRKLKKAGEEPLCKELSHLDEWTTFLVGTRNGKKNN